MCVFSKRTNWHMREYSKVPDIDGSCCLKRVTTVELRLSYLPLEDGHLVMEMRVGCMGIDIKRRSSDKQ